MAALISQCDIPLEYHLQGFTSRPDQYYAVPFDTSSTAPLGVWASILDIIRKNCLWFAHMFNGLEIGNIIIILLITINSQSASHDNWCTETLLNRIITAQWEVMEDVGSARYEPALLPPCPTIRVLGYSNCQRPTNSISKRISEI